MKWNIIYKHIIYKEIAYQLVLYIKVLRVDIYNTLIVITFISYAQSQTIGLAWVMMFNATFNNISVTGISWLSVLLVEETGVPGENHWPVTDKLNPIMLHWVHLNMNGFKLTTLGTDYMGSCKSNYHTIMTAPSLNSIANISKG